MKFPLKVGITGGIGSGKSLVCKILETMGYPVFYSDSEAKSIMHHDKSLKAELIHLLGNQAYLDGELNKSYIAEVVFKTPSLLNQINALVHPRVRNTFLDFVSTNLDKPIVFNEAAILFETGAYKTFDKTILVTAPSDIRIQRVMNRDGVSKDHVLQRMKNQWDDNEKMALADFVILNDETIPLIPQIEEILSKLNP